MDTPSQEQALPLDEVMLAMDVVDTLRHRQDLVERELDETSRKERLIEKLRDLYRHQGIDVPDHILAEGVAALAESRFVYTPPEGGLAVGLARLYVSRDKWGKWVLGGLLALGLVLGAYNFAYRPYVRAQAEAARQELAEILPARMDALYDTIYEETKVQTAVAEAEDLRIRGKAAAAEGDREGAEQAVAGLEALRDTLRQSYILRVVNREGVQSGFWTFPEINTEATNYYIVVEAIDDATHEALSLPIENEETGEIETATMWGLRVSESVYASVAADKQDDGLIQRNIVGVKQYGFLDVDYVVPVLGGAVTQW